MSSESHHFLFSSLNPDHTPRLLPRLAAVSRLDRLDATSRAVRLCRHRRGHQQLGALQLVNTTDHSDRLCAANGDVEKVLCHSGRVSHQECRSHLETEPSAFYRLVWYQRRRTRDAPARRSCRQDSADLWCVIAAPSCRLATQANLPNLRIGTLSVLVNDLYTNGGEHLPLAVLIT